VTEVAWSVGELARLAGVTVRTLHHYDEIGLLSPRGRTAAGYRQYEYADLERLQRILSYRELGFPLDEIASIVDDSTVDPVDHLRQQHALLTDRMERLRRLIAAVEKTMEAHQMGIRLDPEEMFEVFGEFEPTEYAEEAKQRWGTTDAYRESQRRTSSYTKQDWLQLKAESEEVNARMIAAMQSGEPADGEAAMDAAEAHRQQISRWFYDCSFEIHQGLAEMYVADPRFTASYERQAPGLARYVHDAILANAARHAT
jgi:MerR family transcriptional regulator, thiopeptide resistance regulator